VVDPRRFMNIPRERRELVRRRANESCEYCRLPQAASLLPHQVDHIIASQHGGADHDDNLCLCCIRCNLKKGPNIACEPLDFAPM
jgi:5-methylcytosine-specific restriction endonuclease McrA